MISLPTFQISRLRAREAPRSPSNIEAEQRSELKEVGMFVSGCGFQWLLLGFLCVLRCHHHCLCLQSGPHTDSTSIYPAHLFHVLSRIIPPMTFYVAETASSSSSTKNQVQTHLLCFQVPFGLIWMSSCLFLPCCEPNILTCRWQPTMDCGRVHLFIGSTDESQGVISLIFKRWECQGTPKHFLA